MHGLEPTAADLVDAQARHLDRQAGIQGSGSRGVLAGPGGENLPQNDFVDLFRLGAGFLEQGADDLGT